MNIPYIGISLVNKNKIEVLKVLQGVSRYINTIYVKQELLKNEGVDFLIFLNKRYPKKNIVVDLSEVIIIDDFIINIIKKSKINEFILDSDISKKDLEKLIQILNKNKKKIILKGKKFNIDFLNKNKIKKIFFHKEEDQMQKKFWNKREIEEINFFIKENFYVIVGDITEVIINLFDDIPIQEVIIGKDVCYSFNPIKTCKNIYLLLKEVFFE